MEEEWKPIEGYEGLYEVSNLGRVRSISREVARANGLYKCVGRVLCQTKGNGYLYVFLTKDGRRKTFIVHRLVASAFIPNPEGLPMINHKDEDKANNCVDNLEWCTAKYNSNYGTAISRIVAKTSRPIRQLSLSGELIREWPSASEVERQMGISHGNISAFLNHTPRTIKGKTFYKLSAGGYKWEWA